MHGMPVHFMYRVLRTCVDVYVCSVVYFIVSTIVYVLLCNAYAVFHIPLHVMSWLCVGVRMS